MNSRVKLSSHIVDDVLFVKQERQFVKIKLSDIDFIKSRGNYVEIHSGSNERIIKETLKKIQSRLDDNFFFQVHRSYIVNLKKIESVGGNNILVGFTEIPIIKKRKEELLQLLNALQ